MVANRFNCLDTSWLTHGGNASNSRQTNNSHYFSQKKYWDRDGLRNVRTIRISYVGRTYDAHMNEPKGRIKFDNDAIFERFKQENGITNESIGMIITVTISWL